MLFQLKSSEREEPVIGPPYPQNILHIKIHEVFSGVNFSKHITHMYHKYGIMLFKEKCVFNNSNRNTKLKSTFNP